MKNIVRRDIHRRLTFKKFEIKRLLLKAIASNRILAPELVYWARLQLTTLPKKSSESRIRNRCVISGRSRSTYSRLRVSRIVLRQFGALGLIAGLRKASW